MNEEMKGGRNKDRNEGSKKGRKEGRKKQRKKCRKEGGKNERERGTEGRVRKESWLTWVGGIKSFPLELLHLGHSLLSDRETAFHTLLAENHDLRFALIVTPVDEAHRTTSSVKKQRPSPGATKLDPLCA